MILKKIFLYLNPLEFEREIGSDFLFETSFVCYYLNRKLNSIKYKTGKFKKIGINLSEKINESQIFIEDNFLELKLKFDFSEYNLLKSNNDKTNFFLSKINEGVSLINNHYELPIKDLKHSMDEFIKGDYINEWEFKKKKYKHNDSIVLARLICKIDIEKFSLHLRVEKDGSLIKEDEILRTLPDEMIYDHKFKDLIVEDNKVIVVDKFKDDFYSFCW